MLSRTCFLLVCLAFPGILNAENSFSITKQNAEVKEEMVRALVDARESLMNKDNELFESHANQSSKPGNRGIITWKQQKWEKLNSAIRGDIQHVLPKIRSDLSRFSGSIALIGVAVAINKRDSSDLQKRVTYYGVGPEAISQIQRGSFPPSFENGYVFSASNSYFIYVSGQNETLVSTKIAYPKLQLDIKLAQEEADHRKQVDDTVQEAYRNSADALRRAEKAEEHAAQSARDAEEARKAAEEARKAAERAWQNARLIPHNANLDAVAQETFSDRRSKIEGLIRQMAPILVMDPQEEFQCCFPSDPMEYWSREAMVVKSAHPNQLRGQTLIFPGDSASIISSPFLVWDVEKRAWHPLIGNSENLYRGKLGTDVSKLPSNDAGILITSGSMDKYRPRTFNPNVPCYTEYWDDGDRLQVKYWFWWRFNDHPDDPPSWSGLDFGSHEGDWEHVELRLTWIDDKNFRFIYYLSAHGGASGTPGVYWAQTQPNGIKSNPYFFSSEGGHAVYSVPGLHDADYGFSDHASWSGNLWRTGDHLVLQNRHEATSGNPVWDFKGKWGDPEGPPGKERFLNTGGNQIYPAGKLADQPHAQYLGKVIVDGSPEAYNARWGESESWRCSPSIEHGTGYFRIKISNWQHNGPSTPEPIFDLAEEVPFNHDPIITKNLERTSSGQGGWFHANVASPIGFHLYVGHVQHFSGPFFIHLFAGEPGSVMDLPSGFNW